MDDGLLMANPVVGLGKALKLSRKPVDDAEEEVKAMDREQLDAFLRAALSRGLSAP